MEKSPYECIYKHWNLPRNVTSNPVIIFFKRIEKLMSVKKYIIMVKLNYF